MGVIKYKIWHDLWENWGRTVRVIAIIAIGAFAVGTVFGTAEFLLADVARNWRISNPATIGLSVDPAVSEDTLNALENLRGVETVIGWHQETIQWRPDPNTPWKPALLVAIDDYDEQEIRKLILDAGEWPHRKVMGTQRGRGIALGDAVQLDINDKTHGVTIGGEMYNVAHPPPMIAPDPVFFTTPERFAALTGESNYSLVLATIPNYSEVRVQAAADLIQNELEKQDIEVNPAMPRPGGFLQRTSHPDRFIAQDALDGVMLILRTLAITTLILGLFLVYNTINAIIAQQVSQIGVMKAIGAKFGSIVGIYLAMVLVYALVALLISVPLGALGAYGLRFGLVSMFAMTPGPFAISPTAVGLQVVVAIVAPLVIAIVPIVSGASMTVREATSTYGLGGSTGLLDRLITKFQAIPRLLSLTVSNTFRNWQRVTLTQITLVGAGIIFMMVMNVRTSLLFTFDDMLLSIFEVNVLLDLEESARVSKIESLVWQHPDVSTVEVWQQARGTTRQQGTAESDTDQTIVLRGVPVDTVTYQPILRAGRWLTFADEYAVVLNQEIAEELNVTVGDWITVDIPTRRESDWQIVGLLFEPVDQDAGMVPRETLNYETRQTGQGRLIRIQTRRSTAEAEAAVVADLRSTLDTHGYNVLASNRDTANRLVEERSNQMAILLGLLSVMAVLIAVVGAVALSGTLAINVMERTREIGVMRAIGASGGAIITQFIGEGLLLGWLSWLLAIPLSIPAAQLILALLRQLMNIDLVYQFSLAGVGYWLIIISVLAIIASWSPAQKAAQTSVRESLAYA